MSGAERFEDLIAWQKARELVRAIHVVTRDRQRWWDIDLVRQIRRTAVSTMSNIAEGFERDGAAEFEQFLSVAKSSCAEVRSLLYTAWDCDFIEEATFQQLRSQADETGRVIGGLRAADQRHRDEGKGQARRQLHSAGSTQHATLGAKR